MPPTPRPPAASPDLSVVVFGPPRSGKTRLLDALASFARAGEDEPVPLQPADRPPQPGNAIRRQVRVDLPGPRDKTGVVKFLDFDGETAQELLTDVGQLRVRERSALATAVRRTNALVVVVDATWGREQVDEVFAQLQSFFKVLREERTTDREVGGLPVFLTLCKADELAEPNESFTDWLTRVQARTNDLEEEFRGWFGDAAGPFLTFGSTELTVTATATAWPQVTGGVRDATGGLGVEGLCKAVVAAARQHRDRSVRSRRRLNWTAGIAVGLLVVMLLTLIGLAAVRPPAEVEVLTNRVRRMQAVPVANKLADASFTRNRQELQAIHESPVFDQLPTELQEYVVADLRQFDTYAEYRRRFDPPQYAPADVRTSGERAELDTALAGPLAPPPDFIPAWNQTEAVQLWAKWRTDLPLLAEAEREVHAWYTAQLARLTELQLADVPSDRWSPAGWRAAVAEAVARQPPFVADDPLAGSPAVGVPRGEPITWGAAYRYERSAAAAAEWQTAAEKLADTRDLADSVGLTVHPLHPDAVLDWPTPTDPARSLALAGERLTLLRERFPRAAEGKAGWVVSSIHGPLHDTLGRRLKVAAANGVDQVRRLVAADPAAKAGEWAKLAVPSGLLATPAMAEWGELLRLLVKWADPERPDEDPVKELAAFVGKAEFRWDITRITLRMPNALRVNTPEKASDLTVRVGDGDKRREYKFTAGPLRVDANTTTVEFTPANGAVRYEPGEACTAAVVLTDKDGGYTLRWAEARTAAFRFEALLREPVMESVGPNPVPQRADGVRLTVATDPMAERFRVPLLLPEIK